jgi:hypothetical protein
MPLDPEVSFQSDQRRRLAAYALERYGVEGHVLPYELLAEVLHEGFRDEALGYFVRHKIRWWTSRSDIGRPPGGHLNSSQVACVNHLEPARLDADVARSVLAALDPDLVEPIAVEDGGFVAYEWIGEANYLNARRASLAGRDHGRIHRADDARAERARADTSRPAPERSVVPETVERASCSVPAPGWTI